MLFTDTSLVDEFKAELAEITAKVSKLQARRLVILNQLERCGVTHQDGARTMIEWTATHLDITTGAAQEMVSGANQIHRQDPLLFEQMEAGTVTLDRAMATLALAATEAPDTIVDRSFDMDLSAVARLTHQYRRIRRKDERQAFRDRHFVMQPSLDESHWRGWFELGGVDGSVVDKAMSHQADLMRKLPGGEYLTRTQRRADALVAISQDSLDSDITAFDGASGSNVAIFVDLDRANDTGGELGAEVEYGPRVGPNTLEELVCTGSVQITGLQDGKPVVTSDNTKTIPPAVRRFVAWRDGGCTVTGCTSRYRLQPHHVQHRHHHGDHDPDNLTTLCWFHHHVAIHGAGFRLQPDGPPGSRRLMRPRRYHDPP